MNRIVFERTRELAHSLMTRYPSAVVDQAILVRILSENDENGLDDRFVELAGKIYTDMTVIDEPRYSLYDYADAIANARMALDLGKLLALDRDSFAAAMLWLATDKRETYEDLEHAQEPLEIDIVANDKR